MAIHQTISNYLDAVEKSAGIEARSATELEYRGGRSFFLKRSDDRHGQIVDMGNLTLMTRQLQAAA
ncbi:hypothetical protein FE236_04990 [Mariprofundus erugo]|uniref:Uncharacterized protein n=1 Tax=Mariprofundus erugo TaxID=2528639 RepID=A0A5R9GPV1_9PROT|nr:hypothetical protein [Mariprofundus erugo]TLS68291.1 hypothetical protein FEF65_04675 [Mariprofundus erugo]TLS77146.1 hypothetical protein FE236_04990 [Mariprofundus erugo]